MATWWPWRRTHQPQEASPAPAPAAWRDLAPIQRTVDPVEPTAAFADFSSSLTLSRNPALIGTVQTLSIDHAGTLPVLGVDHRPAHEDSTPTVPQSHSWHARPDLPQRILPAPAAVQRVAETPAAPAPVPEPVVTVPATPVDPEPMTIAPDPADRREVPVVAEMQAAPAAAAPETDDAPSITEPVVRQTVTEAAPPPGPSPSAPVQRTTEQPPVPPPQTPPPMPVPRAVETPPTGPAPHVPSPVAQRAVDVPAPRPSPPPVVPVPRAVEPVPTVTESVDTPATVQRSTPEESITWFAPDEPVALPARPAPPDVTRPAAPLPGRTPAIQRIASVPPTFSAAPQSSSVAPPPVPPVSSVQRTPVTPAPGSPSRAHELVETPPTTDVPGPPVRDIRPLSASQPVQRSVEPGPVPTVSVPTPPPTNPAHVQRVTAQPTAAPTAAPAPIVSELPTRRDAPLADPAPTAPPSEIASAPAVQRVTEQPSPPLRGRLVVLPPLRSHGPDLAPDTGPAMPTMPSTPDVNFEGAQTMSLQRMFEHTATAAPRRAAAPAPSAPAWPSTVVTQGDGYTEVTWPQPAVQREADTPGPEPAPEPAPATDQPADTPPEPGTGTAAPQSVSTATTTAQASAGAPGTNLDELVQRLYDPLAARLRAELWQDRERAGALMDLRR